MPEFSEAQRDSARELLNLCGVRIFRRGDRLVIGVWSDLICPELRMMLAAVGLDELELVELDGPDVPISYKVRRCPARGDGQSWLAYRRQLQERASTSAGH